MDKKNKITVAVLGIFALVIVTTGASFAFFSYSRTSNNKTTITTGDLQFSYFERKDSLNITDQYPLRDTIGATDNNNAYEFQVGMNSTSSLQKMVYDVILVTNNTGTNNFTNDQIKFALTKEDTYVAGTSATTGRKLSELDGLDEASSSGEAVVLDGQEIKNGEVDNYKLRIWISDDVNYSNTVNGQDEPTSTGKYNSKTYSLKVKVQGELSTTMFSNLDVGNDGTITVDIEDQNGLKAYALTNSKSTPQDSEWVNIDATAKSNSKVKKVANIRSKTLTLEVDNKGTYYLHVKNSLNQISRKTIEIKNDIVKTFGLYDYIKENADKTTVINFSEHSGISGTNGIYTTTATESGGPVYYYRGNVNNNLVFNNMCWKIIRTTETGGIKIIYSGTPTSDGKCKPNFTAGTETAQSGTTYMPSYYTYYYGSSYTFDENEGYKLSGTITSGKWTESFASSVMNMFTCKLSSPIAGCTTLYKITGYSSTSEATYSQIIRATVNTDTQIGTSKFNTNYSDNAYVGYMYGSARSTTYAATHANTNNSTIKTYIDSWYKTNFNSTATNKLEDTVFCNDRSPVAGGNNNTESSSTYGTLGYGTNPTGYGALARSSYSTTSPNPTYACEQANDKFTLKTTQTNYNSNLNGNKKLDYPVGLITSDEAIFAGFNTNKSNTSNYNDTNNYLYTGLSYWTFSPIYYYYGGPAYVSDVDSTGIINGHYVDYYAGGVRPVVSLIPGTLAELGGTGTLENPYIVK